MTNLQSRFTSILKEVSDNLQNDTNYDLNLYLILNRILENDKNNYYNLSIEILNNIKKKINIFIEFYKGKEDKIDTLNKFINHHNNVTDLINKIVGKNNLIISSYNLISDIFKINEDISESNNESDSLLYVRTKILNYNTQDYIDNIIMEFINSNISHQKGGGKKVKKISKSKKVKKTIKKIVKKPIKKQVKKSGKKQVKK
jgi:hypothetical protein